MAYIKKMNYNLMYNNERTVEILYTHVIFLKE